MRIWDAATGALLIDFSPSMQTYVVDASWNPDSTRLATASDDEVVRIWNIKEANHAPGEILATIIPNPNPNTVLSFVRSVAWHPNGQLLAIGSTDGGYTLQIWDATTYQPVKQFRTGWITHLTWLPDSHRNILLVTNEMADATIFSIDAPEVQGIAPIGRYVAAEAADWNSDGSKIAVGYEDGTIYVWDEVTNSLLVVILSTKSAAPIRNLDWSFDDRKLISSDSNGMVRIWNSTSGEILQEVPARTLAVAFSPTSDAFAYGGGNGDIILRP